MIAATKALRHRLRPLVAAACLGAVTSLAAVPASARGPEGIADVAEKVIDAVVNISTSQNIEAKTDGRGAIPQLPPGSPFEEFFDDFFKNRRGGGGKGGERNNELQPHKTNSLGSGFIIDSSGIVVTNNHVIADADEINVILNDGSKIKADIVGVDKKTDLAVLKFKPARPLTAVKFGDSDKLRLGDWVVAIGNPFSLGGTVTAGIVSAKNRDISSGPYDSYIQTDAAINRGNSGGPLFDMDGKVIGINTAIFSPSGGSIGLGFAIPASLAQPVVAQLKDHGRVERGLLGVQIQPVTDEIANSLSLGSSNGALVAQVEPDSAAMKAGIKSGDVIKSVDGKDVATIRDLTRTIAAAQPGSTVKIGLMRDGKDMTISAKLGDSKPSKEAKADEQKMPEKASPGSFGFSLAPLSPDTRQQLGLKDNVSGALIAAVEPGSPADEQGLKAGDVLQQVGKEQVGDAQDAVAKLKDAKASKKPVLMKIYREGMTRFVAVSPRAA